MDQILLVPSIATSPLIHTVNRGGKHRVVAYGQA